MRATPVDKKRLRALLAHLIPSDLINLTSDEAFEEIIILAEKFLGLDKEKKPEKYSPKRPYPPAFEFTTRAAFDAAQEKKPEEKLE